MRRVLPVVLLLALCSTRAVAQPRSEWWAGYSVARDPRDDVTLPVGWVAGAAIDLTPGLSLVADVSGHYKTVPLVTADARLSTLAIMGGLRGSARVGRLREFGQVVAGLVRSSGSAFGLTTTGQSLAVQPGAGVDYPVTTRWAVRAEIDVRLMRSQPDAVNGGYQYRFATVLAYRLR